MHVALDVAMHTQLYETDREGVLALRIATCTQDNSICKIICIAIANQVKSKTMVMHACSNQQLYTKTCSGQLGLRAYARNTRVNRYSTLQQLFIDLYTPVLYARNFMLNNVGRNK